MLTGMNPYANLYLMLRQVGYSEGLDGAEERKCHLSNVAHVLVSVSRWAAGDAVQAVADSFHLTNDMYFGCVTCTCASDIQAAVI